MKNSCRYHDLADRFVHDELSTDERKDFENHIVTCSECSNETNGLLRLKAFVGSAYPVQLDETFNYRVLTSLRAERETSVAKEMPEALGDIAISLVTLLAIALLGLQLFSPTPRIAPVEMVGGLTTTEQLSLEPSNLSNDQVVEIALRSK
ncbi:MAG TPA: zf-HC2 domain-containing protein [Candidatus Kryptonia bacterium]